MRELVRGENARMREWRTVMSWTWWSVCCTRAGFSSSSWAVYVEEACAGGMVYEQQRREQGDGQVRAVPAGFHVVQVCECVGSCGPKASGRARSDANVMSACVLADRRGH